MITGAASCGEMIGTDFRSARIAIKRQVLSARKAIRTAAKLIRQIYGYRPLECGDERKPA